MRLVVHLFGREVFRVSTDPPDEQQCEPEHDNVAAQVELAAEVPIGFVSQPNPSVS